MDITSFKRIVGKAAIRSAWLIPALLVLGMSPALAQVTGTITGTISDPLGSTVPDVEVLVAGEAGRYEAVSDSNGRFTVDDVLPGSYIVTAVREGFSVLDATVDVVGGSEVPLDLVMRLAAIAEAITVTAERREASIMEVPIAVTALTGEDRDLFNIVNITDLADITPNMEFNIFPNRVTIRGIGRTFNALGMDPGVANYVDGTYTSEVGGTVDIPPMFVERTEVLRGPQGTLFGRNAVGGLVNTITRRPDSAFNGEFRLWGGEYQQYGGGLTLSGPMAQNGPFYRVNLSFARRDEGFQTNVGSGPEVNTYKNTRAEFHLQYDFTNSFAFWMRATTWPSESSPSGVLRRGPYFTEGQMVSCCTPSPQWDLTGNPSINANEVALDYEGHRQKTEDVYTVVGELTYTTKAALFKYMGRWSTYDWTQDIDWDGTNRSSYIDPIYGEIFTGMSNFVGEYKDYSSHELQFLSMTDSNLRWMAGFYYYDESIQQPYEENVSSAVGFENTNLVWWLSPTFTPSDPGPPNPSRAYYYQYPWIEANQNAAYAQLDYSLGSKWTLGLGARYSRDEKTGYEENALFSYNPFAGNYPFAPNAYHPDQIYTYWGPIPTGTTNNKRTLEDTWSAPTGRFSAHYQASLDTMLYGSVSTGYKSGGFRLGALMEDPVVDEETVVAYELGGKFLLAKNNALQLTTALFWNDYRDQQIPVMRLEPLTGIGIQELYNIPKTETGGLELEMTWQPAVGSRIGLSYGYLRTEILSGLIMQDSLDPVGAPGNFKDVTGNTLQRAPEHQVALFGAYTFDMSSGGYFTLSADASWVDEQHNSPFEGDSWHTYPSYARAGLRLMYGHPNDAFRLILQVRNLTNAEYLGGVGNSGQYSGFVHTEWLMPPRQLFLEFQKRF